MCMQKRLKYLLCAVLVSIAFLPGCRSARADKASGTDVRVVRLRRAPEVGEKSDLPLVVWTERRSEPRPLAISVARLDLECPDIQISAMVADDPDGKGPAEAALTDPRELAKARGALVAVNANAFSALPDETGERPQGWRTGMPVDIAGLVVTGGDRLSGSYGHAGNDLCFWLSEKDRPHIGPLPGEYAPVREAVNAWWIDLVKDGKILPRSGGDRHPRTAIGLDENRRWLFLVVVDGRQPGYSTGMTGRELAELMLRLGADRAINLDGGGSSIMLAHNPNGQLQIVNRPSGGKPRPIPVLLGVKSRRP